MQVNQFFIDFKRAYDSVRREVLYKIIILFGIPRTLVRLVKMSLTESYSRVRVGKYVSDRFPIRNGFKQGNPLSPMSSNVALIAHIIKKDRLSVVFRRTFIRVAAAV